MNAFAPAVVRGRNRERVTPEQKSTISPRKTPVRKSDCLL
jgi:hypothetical protein